MKAQRQACLWGMVPALVGTGGFAVPVFFALRDAACGRVCFSSDLGLAIAFYLLFMLPLILCSILCFYVSSAFVFGFANKVVGDVSSATIIRNKSVISPVPLSGVRVLGDGFSINGHKVVFFRSGLRPYICLENSFCLDHSLGLS
jgi:hypothetical protein